MKKYILLHLSFFIFSFGSIFSKFAANEKFLSFNFIIDYGIMLFILFIYAILWQQTLKKLDLSIAYSNKAVMIVWASIWDIIIFKEVISIKAIISAILICIGILIMNRKEVEK